MSFYLEASPETRKRRLPYIVASLAILSLTTASGVMYAVRSYKLLFEVAPGPENVEAGLEILFRSQDTAWSVASLLDSIALRIGDTVLLYRCYVLWYESPWIIVLPACALIAGTGINLRTYIPLTFSSRKLDAADIFLLVGTNVLLTSLISLRLLRAQRQLRLVLPNTDHKVYFGILGILIESAAPVAVFGFSSAIATLYTSKFFQAKQAADILSILFFIAIILAPQLIIFRVATGTSWGDKADTSAMLSRSIEFNASAQTKPDEESGIEHYDH